MQKTKLTKLLCLVLSLVMILGAAPITVFAAGNVVYIDREWNETTKTVVETEKTATAPTVIDSTTTSLADNGWYVVNGTVTVSGRIDVQGTAYIILTDGCKLIAGGGIEVSSDHTLVIYGQTNGTGTLEATGAEYCTGIGGGGTRKSGNPGGTVTVYGGAVTATGSDKSAGIGGSYQSSGGMFTIYGGTVTANGGEYGAGIGGGQHGAGDTVTVYGGTVTANGGKNGAGIGGGQYGAGGTVTIYGGTVTANGGSSGAGIGSGAYGFGATVTIFDGTVTATGGEYSAGIGGGHVLDAGISATVTIFGGTVTAKGTYWGPGIGSGYRGDGCAFTMYGGTVTAIGQSCPAIGGGHAGTANGTVANGCLIEGYAAYADGSKFDITTDNDGKPYVDCDSERKDINDSTFRTIELHGLPHTHALTTAWSFDENAHWHECTALFCDIENYATSTVEGIAYGAHTVVNGVCTVCGKVFTVYTAENNVLTATVGITPYTLTLKDDGTLSAEEISAWEAAGLTVPEIVLDAAANTASITAKDATATVTLAEGALKTHTVTVICGADENGNNIITDVLAGTDFTVIAGTYENKLFEKWLSELNIDGSTENTVTFRMPNEDVTVEAQFVDCYPLSVYDGTTFTSEPQIVDTAVTVTAPATPEGMRFTGWTAEGITLDDPMASDLEFTMPENAVTLTLNYAALHTVTVTGGKITGAGTTCQAIAGETVSVTADTVSGHNFTGWTGEGIEFDNAASMTTTFTMPEADASVTANFEQIKVAIPTAGTETYTYNGYAQTYQFANEGDVSYYELIGDSTTQTNAGTYTIKAKLTVDGTAWTDGTTADKEYTFVIARQPVDKPIAYNTQYYYTGEEQNFILCRQIGSSYYYYESCVPAGSVVIANTTRTNAGTQTVTATPTANYCWPDGTTGTLYFSFTINRHPIPTLFEDPRSFTYNGNAQTYTPFVMRNGSLYDFDGLYYNLSNRTQTASGSYTVTATLRNNFCWYDGSTAARNFSFNIRMKELDSFIYYVNDLKTGEKEVCVDMTYTLYDNTNTLKGFESRPGFKPEMLKDRYQPCLMNVPAGADVMFYLKETPGTPKNLSEVNKCKRWNDVKMSDLQPDTIYYMFAVVTHPDYPGFQITEINNMSRFITSDPQFTLINCKRVTQTESNQSYKSDCAMAIYSGNINDMLGAFGNKSTTKTTNVTTKAAKYTVFEEAIAQAVKDVEGGLDGALVGWYDENGVMQSFSIFPSNVNQYKSVLKKLTAMSAAPRKMLAAPAGDPAELTPVEITGISGEVPELTPELLNAMFTPEELALLPLDTAAFKMEMELETGAEQIEAEKEALIAKLAALDIMPDEESDEFFGTVRIDSFLYDMKTEAVDGGTVEYKLGMGEKLPADAVKEIEGYTFIGLYYAEIMGFEKEAKSEEATGDHGMILTQGLVKWDPETDFVTRDLDLMALYVKDGAEEPVGYLAAGTTFLDEGSEVEITLPALMDGMTYGDVVNDNAAINVSAINDGKVTVTLANDVTGDEPFTFTVGVNANKEGIEDPFYYILVTVNAVDETAIKEEAAETIEALADDTASDEVKAIISEAVASLENANSIEAVNEIAAKAEAAVELQTAKEDAIAAIDVAIEADDPESVTTAAEEAKAAIENAESVDEVEAAKTSGLEKMEDVRGRCPYCGRKGHENFFAAFFCLLVRFLRMLTMFFTGGRSIIGSL